MVCCSLESRINQCIRQATSELHWPDRLGHWRARWGTWRMKYKVEPGLYALGNPDENSEVFVSANYKMSFDRLRSNLTDRNGWILVLDTKGINVWCAAGKGTFGTDELVNRIESAKLNERLAHRQLIVPQLGATGVSAHEVKKRTGFNVVYGPIRANDLPEFLNASMKATEQMRQVRFNFIDRIVLIPIEIMFGIKYAILIIAFFFFASGLSKNGYSFGQTVTIGLPVAALLSITYLAANILGPALLPWLGGRAFSLKGFWIGLVIAAAAIFYADKFPGIINGSLDTIAWLLILPALTSFIVMSFTGASTYTSLSGVKREMKIAVPMQLIAVAIGLISWLVERFI